MSDHQDSNAPLHILVIEDEEANRNVLLRVLEPTGHRITLASDGQEGIDFWMSDPADIVITDYVMPRKNGIDVIRELRSKNPKLPIIMTTGSIDPKLNALPVFLHYKPDGFRLILEIVEKIIASASKPY